MCFEICKVCANARVLCECFGLTQRGRARPGPGFRKSKVLGSCSFSTTFESCSYLHYAHFGIQKAKCIFFFLFSGHIEAADWDFPPMWRHRRQRITTPDTKPLTNHKLSCLPAPSKLRPFLLLPLVTCFDSRLSVTTSTSVLYYLKVLSVPFSCSHCRSWKHTQGHYY